MFSTKKLAANKTVILNVVCAVLMLVLLVMQFSPYWSFEVEIPTYREEVDMEQFKVEEEATEEGTAATPAAPDANAEAEAEEEEVLPYIQCPDCGKYIRKDDPSTPVTMIQVPAEPRVEKRSASISDYLWFPYEHSECKPEDLSDPATGKEGKSGLENYMNKELKGEKVSIDSVKYMPLIYFVLFLLCVFCAITKASKPTAQILAFIGGLVALIGYLAVPVFALGTSWVGHIVVAAIVTLASGASTAYTIIDQRK